MEFTTLEMTHVVDAIALTESDSLILLKECELMCVGGGIGDFIPG